MTEVWLVEEVVGAYDDLEHNVLSAHASKEHADEEVGSRMAARSKWDLANTVRFHCYSVPFIAAR